MIPLLTPGSFRAFPPLGVPVVPRFRPLGIRRCHLFLDTRLHWNLWTALGRRQALEIVDELLNLLVVERAFFDHLAHIDAWLDGAGIVQPLSHVLRRVWQDASADGGAASYEREVWPREFGRTASTLFGKGFLVETFLSECGIGAFHLVTGEAGAE